VYKFVMVDGTCGAPYDLKACEIQANKMLKEGYTLSHIYQSNTSACMGSSKAVLVMVFKQT
jgi:hypothetical protein